jgi:ketosteroid isomerase-like protein
VAERPGSAVGATKAEVASELYAAFDFKSAAAGELDSLFERLAVPDLEVQPPPVYPDMRTYRGLDEVKAFWGMLTEVWEEWSFEPGAMEDAGDKLLVEVHLYARGLGSGLELPSSGWHVLTFRDGKVAKIHTVMDESEARKVAGLPDLQSPR